MFCYLPSSYPYLLWLLPAASWPVCTSRGSEDAHSTGLVPRRVLTAPPLCQPLSKVPVMAWECSAVWCDGLKCLFIFSFLCACDMNWRGYADCSVTLSLLWHGLGFAVVTGVWVEKRQGRRGVIVDWRRCMCVCECDDIPIHACFHLLLCWLHGCLSLRIWLFLFWTESARGKWSLKFTYSPSNRVSAGSLKSLKSNYLNFKPQMWFLTGLKTGFSAWLKPPFNNNE